MEGVLGLVEVELRDFEDPKEHTASVEVDAAAAAEEVVVAWPLLAGQVDQADGAQIANGVVRDPVRDLLQFRELGRLAGEH